MATFSYTGLSDTDTKLKGVVEAFDEIEAMEKARERCRVVQSVVEVKEKKSLGSIEITKHNVKPKSLAILSSQYAIILQAGLSVARASELVADQTTDKYLNNVLEETSVGVSSGNSLADSLESKGPELPRVFIETIRAGEESGSLPVSFARLHSYYDKRSKIASKVASALTYPIFVLIIAVIVVAVMMVMVIPAIAGMVSSLGSEMPAITQFLIDASDWFRNNFLWIILVTVIIFLAARLYLKSEQGKTQFAQLQMRIPIIGKVVTFSGAAQFANTMATLIASGLSTSHSVRITGRVMSNHVLANEVSRMESGLLEGRSLGSCMQESKNFPRTLVEMCTVGEETGELEATLETVGEFYDSETQRVTDRALSLMEPILLVLMAVFAGFIVVALYLPMFTMYSNMS